MQHLRFVHNAIEAFKVGAVVDWLAGVVQQVTHHLDLSQRVVAFLLSRRGRGADGDQVVNTLSHSSVQVNIRSDLICYLCQKIKKNKQI